MKARLTLLLCSLALPVLAAEPVKPAATAPKSAQPQLLAEGLGETAMGLIIVLLVILALAWLAKRYGSRLPMARGPVQVIGGVSLGPRERAVLLSVDGARLLVGVAPGQVRTLHVLDGEVPPDFADKLNDAQQEAGQ